MTIAALPEAPVCARFDKLDFLLFRFFHPKDSSQTDFLIYNLRHI